MEFSVEFYTSEGGQSPVKDFLLEIKGSDPDDFAAVAAGLVKLRHRQNHRAPLTKPINDGLFELRHVGKLNTRVLRFFMKGRRIIAFATKVRRFRPATYRPRGPGCWTGWEGIRDEQDEFRYIP